MADNDEFVKCDRAECEENSVMSIGSLGVPNNYCIQHSVEYMEYATAILLQSAEAMFIRSIKERFGI